MPGVGHKTASVVMSQAFGDASVPSRYPYTSADVSLGVEHVVKNVEQTENEMRRGLFPRDKWNKLHLQIIFYGTGVQLRREASD